MASFLPPPSLDTHYSLLAYIDSTTRSMALFADMYRKGGIAGINKGVNAVAIRQCTNWGSRMGFARLAEQSIRKSKGLKDGDKLSTLDRIAASTVGGALGCWNQPIEVVRVEVSLSCHHHCFPIHWLQHCDESLTCQSTFGNVHESVRCNRWPRRPQSTDLPSLPSSTLLPSSTRRMESKVSTVVSRLELV